MKRITEFALLVVIILLMLISVIVNVAPHMGILISEIGSGSMSPTFEIGTMVVAAKVDPAELQVNNIIVFEGTPSANNYTSHRIIAVSSVSPLVFTTKGDNNPVADPTPVPAVNIVGKIIFTAPLMGYFVQFQKTGIGLILCLIIPALILIGICVQLIWREFIRMVKDKVKKDNIA